MGFFNAIGSCYRNMFNFSGRARRKEYWYFFLFQVLVAIALPFAMVIVFATGDIYGVMWQLSQIDPAKGAPEVAAFEQFAAYYLWYCLAYFFAIWLPQLAVTVRRLHDTDHSGWLLLLPLAITILGGVGGAFLTMMLPSLGMPILILATAILPLIVYVYIFVLLCMAGSHGNNTYGPDPVPGRKRQEFIHPAYDAARDEGEQRAFEAHRRAEIRELYRTRVLGGQKA